MKRALAALYLFVFLACNTPPHSDVPADTTQKQKDTLPIQPLSNSYVPVDLSPMDISYFPTDYPLLKMSGTAPTLPQARVIYSRPHMQGRTIFGDMVKWGEPWRLGANEATEIEFFSPVTIQNKRINAGRYTLYCIPQPGHWTIVFNSNLYSWGLKPDPSKDLFRFDIPSEKTDIPIEYFTMTFEKTNAGADLVIAWENLSAHLPLRF